MKKNRNRFIYLKTLLDLLIPKQDFSLLLDKPQFRLILTGSQLKFSKQNTEYSPVKVEWFLFIEGDVHGPYSTEDIQAKLDNDSLDEDVFIWWKGQHEWMPIDSWENYLDTSFTGSGISENTRLWRLKIQDKAYDALKFSEVKQRLEKLDTLKHCYVAYGENADWEEVYTHKEILTELGLSQRKFIRAPLLGNARVVKFGSRFAYDVKISDIGQGGMGVNGLGNNFTADTVVEIRVDSPNLTAPLRVTGNIVYTLNDGYFGIEFQSVGAEAQSIILDYIRKFDSSITSDAA